MKSIQIKKAFVTLGRVLLSRRQAHLLVENLRLFRSIASIFRKRLFSRNPPKALQSFAGECALQELRVAAILDEFTKENLAKEARVVNLLSGSSIEQLEQFLPNLLFVESASQGESGSWTGRLVKPDSEIKDIVRWCRERGVPTVFWNKEDPIHFKSYLGTAAKFDFVFTTDSDCLAKYKKLLGKDVSTLPFAASEKLYSPFDSAERNGKAFFSGSFYRQYPQRQLDTVTVIDAVSKVMDVDIFDRNLEHRGERTAFPAKLKATVKPRKTYLELVEDYKEYAVCITLNTVKFSPTMMARRSIEAALSNCILVSNQCDAIYESFGQSAIISDDPNEIVNSLNQALADPEIMQEMKIKTMISALESHLLKNVFGRLVEQVFPGMTSVSGPLAGELCQAIKKPGSLVACSCSDYESVQQENNLGFSFCHNLQDEEMKLAEELTRLTSLLFANYPSVGRINFELASHNGNRCSIVAIHICIFRTNEETITLSQPFSGSDENFCKRAGL